MSSGPHGSISSGPVGSMWNCMNHYITTHHPDENVWHFWPRGRTRNLVFVIWSKVIPVGSWGNAVALNQRYSSCIFLIKRNIHTPKSVSYVIVWTENNPSCSGESVWLLKNESYDYKCHCLLLSCWLESERNNKGKNTVVPYC